MARRRSERDRPQREGTPEAEARPGEVADVGVAAQGLYFFGVARVRHWRRGASGDDSVARLRYRDIEALVQPVPYAVPDLDEEGVRRHQHAVEGAMRGGTVLPAPYGIVFRSRRELIRMLQDQYLVLDEGLSLLDGHWELRLHFGAASGERSEEMEQAASAIYTELRRFARAAVPLPRVGERVLSAAFLVERATWLEFLDRAQALVAAKPELGIDVTGPWPPYDFVRLTG
jgi:hypothetical protein